MTLLMIGIVAGVAASRDAIIDEFGDVAQAMLALDQSMTIDFPLQVIVHDNTDISSASDSVFHRCLHLFRLRPGRLPRRSGAPALSRDIDS